MLRVVARTLNIRNRVCNPNNFNISSSELNVQSVRRWRYRRPLELGTSKSKLFRIPVHPERNEEELAELERLNAIFYTETNALMGYYMEKNANQDEGQAQIEQSLDDDAEFERISKINDEWAHKVGQVREARLKSERIAMQEEIQFQLKQQREYEEEQRRISNELVLKEKEAAKSFIVRENFDEALETALQTKTDFNYAIDLQGDILSGRTGGKKKLTTEAGEQERHFFKSN